MKITAIILAAGYSSRMGAFKPLLDICGKSALFHLLGSITDAGIRDIIIVTGHYRDEIESAASEFRGDGKIRLIYNEDFANGMFSSIQVGLAGLSASSCAMVFPVDTPLVSAATVMRLAEAACLPDFSDECCIVPTFLGKKGHPILIPSEIITQVLSYDGGGGLKGAISASGAVIRLIETEDEGAVLDMDTTDDYADMFLLADNSGLIDSVVRGMDEYNRVFIVRHGEIRQHSGKILLGQADVPLSDNGRAEAKTAAESLTDIIKSESNVRIVSSDLSRATETADIIAARIAMHGGSDLNGNTCTISNGVYNGMSGSGYLGYVSSIELYAGLREIDLGAWDGRFKTEIEKQFPEEYAIRGSDIISWKNSGGENYYDVRYRVLKTLRRILADKTHDTCERCDLVIVTHAGPVRAINSVFTEKSLAELMAWRVPRCVPLHLDGCPW